MVSAGRLAVVLAVLALTGCGALTDGRRPATVEVPPPGAEAPRPTPPAAPTLAADQLTRLADEVSDLRNAVSQLVAGARQRGDQISDLQRRVGELEVQGRTRPAGVPSGFAPPPPGEGPVQAPSLTTKTAEELYQVGMAKFQAKDFDAAVLLFYELIVTYPSHALRESAQFLVAEIFYAQKDYRGALAEFQALVRDVPRGRKVPDALVKIGLTQRELGERDTAQRTWERVLRDYPTSVAARQARVLLRR
ncbi:MAG: tol-pal system protein YbgF [Elusimicrobia bacterium GWA2_69_24]|nr:MAG: tol-pal system protein YbgF [Elusimicrobia bacterium GWA2_69_24]HBH00728.1 tol-pal system protein YbgF [Candidatus Rokubacteria bacterium]